MCQACSIGDTWMKTCVYSCMTSLEEETGTNNNSVIIYQSVYSMCVFSSIQVSVNNWTWVGSWGTTFEKLISELKEIFGPVVYWAQTLDY